MASRSDGAEWVESLLGGAPCAIAMLLRGESGALDVRFANEQAEMICGVSPDDLERDGGLFFASAHPDDVARLRAALDRAARDGLPLREEYRVEHPTRGQLWVEARAQPHREPDGSTLFCCLILEITERHRTEEALRQSRERLALALAAGNLGTFVWDIASGEPPVLDDAALALLGRTRAELVGTGGDQLDTFIHPDDKVRVVRAREALLAAGDRYSLRYRVVLPDGRTRWLETDAGALRDAAGDATRVSGVFRDVTKEVETAAALRASEERFESLFRLAPVPLLLARLDGFVVAAVNEAFAQLFGVSPGDVVGRSVHDFPSAAGGSVRKDFIDQFLRDGFLHGVELSFVDPRGESRFFQVSADRIVLGGEAHVLAVVVDLTKRRAAEAALAASEERLRQVTSAIPHVIWMTDASGEALTYVSAAYEAVWGRSREALEHSPRDWFDAIHADDRERVLAAGHARLPAGTYDEEYRIVRGDGAERWIRDRATPLRTPAGELIGYVGVAEDITERRSLEAQLRETQKLESVGLLAGGVAHDFNNLLTVISACTEEVLEELPESSPSRAPLLETRDAVARAASLTRDLLAFSRREVHAPAVVALDATVRDGERLMRRILGEDVALTLELDAAGALVKLDPAHWSSVLVNLAVNARDAMPRGGRLTLRTRTANLDGAAAARIGLPQGAYAIVEVVDSGVGMAPDVRARVFEPFFTTKARGRGTGIGLAVVHGIVSQIGGHIEVESEPGRGSTFRIFLPIAPAPPAEAADERAPRSAPRASGRTVLLVEDDLGVRRVAARVLAASGYRVQEAGDGREALETLLAPESTIDLVITDVVLPSMSGPELVAAIREKKPALRVLYTSGYADDDVVRYGVTRADVAFLAKPYTAKALVAKVGEALEA